MELTSREIIQAMKDHRQNRGDQRVADLFIHAWISSVSIDQVNDMIDRLLLSGHEIGYESEVTVLRSCYLRYGHELGYSEPPKNWKQLNKRCYKWMMEHEGRVTTITCLKGLIGIW